MDCNENMIREKLSLPQFAALPHVERESFLRSIVEIHPRFELLHFACFERFGMSVDTAVYAYNGVEFVFVPGASVTLGWENFAVGMNEKTRNKLRESLANWEIDDVDAYLRENMSPEREVAIGPMLVERAVNTIGWRQVFSDSAELETYRKEIENGKQYLTSHGGYQLHRRFKMRRVNNEIQFFLYEPLSLADLQNKVAAAGFSLPTEDEWEYLCGGGSRTLFRWGDSFDFEMKLHQNMTVNDDKSYTLELPNQFGITIAHNPYMWEVCENSDHFLKGGDGGCNLCGGMGLVMGYLPVATYFRTPMTQEEEEAMDLKNDIGGDYTFYRRVMRL